MKMFNRPALWFAQLCIHRNRNAALFSASRCAQAIALLRLVAYSGSKSLSTRILPPENCGNLELRLRCNFEVVRGGRVVETPCHSVVKRQVQRVRTDAAGC